MRPLRRTSPSRETGPRDEAARPAPAARPRLGHLDRARLILLAVALAAVPAGTAAGDARALDVSDLLASGVAAEAPPASAWLAASETGDPLTLSINAQTFEVFVSPSEGLFVPGAHAHDAAGNHVDLSGVHPLAGSVAGAPDATVRVTVFGESVTGAIWGPGVGHFTVAMTDGGAAIIDVSSADLQIPPMRLDDHDDDDDDLPPLPPWVPSPNLPPIAVPDWPESEDPFLVPGGTFYHCSGYVPYAIATPIGLTDGWTERNFDIAFAVDDPFVQHYGEDDWAGVAIGIVNVTDGFYDRELNLRVRIADLHAHPREVFTSAVRFGANTRVLMDELIEHYEAEHTNLDRDATYLMTGVNLLSGSGAQGAAAGQASCIGGAGNPEEAWIVGMAAHINPSNVAGFVLYGDLYVKILAHEAGHLLNTHHHYGNCTEVAVRNYDTNRPTDICTIMYYEASRLSLTMSTLERLVMRGWADGVDL